MSLGKVDGFVDPSGWFSELDPALKVNLDSLIEIIQVIISKILRTLLNFIKKTLSTIIMLRHLYTQILNTSYS